MRDIRCVCVLAVAMIGCGQPPARPATAPPPLVFPGGAGPIALAANSGAYAGSKACQPCHAAIYDRWKVTPMANVVRDPREHPDAILPDLSKPDPLLTFRLQDIAFVYGSRWKQRYFQRVGDDFFPLPAQWDVTHKVWKPYHVGDNTDWWVPFYGKNNNQRPTGPLCDGCHSVNYNLQTKTPSEWNVGCEQCHGPAADHVKAPARNNVINPIRLDAVAANDICIQCHSQGRPLQDRFEGNVYDWPVGYRAGKSLREFWQLEDHTLGETTFTHFADGTAHKNRMQGNDFVQSVMYERGVRCSSCHDTHGTSHPAQLVLPVAKVCGKCHAPGGPNGPRAATLEQHTHHRAGSEGSACVACHMPRIAQTLGDVNVRSHTFKFVPPSVTERSKVPNACTTCHADKSPAWATAALRSWDSTSPWRVAP